MKSNYLFRHRLRRYLFYSIILLATGYTILAFYGAETPSGLLDFARNSPFKTNVPRLFQFLESTADNGTTWKISNSHRHHTLSLVPEEYISLRSKLHHHDPRITIAAASHYLSSKEELELPFSWQDWVDLAALNPYVLGEKPDCSQFLGQGLDFPNGHTTNSNYNEIYCLDDAKFLESHRGGFHDPKLLPGFNFQQWMSAKKTFAEKFIFAKSLVLSGLDPPSNMFFLTDHDGYIKVKPIESQSMVKSGILSDYFKSLDLAHDGTVEIDPLSHFQAFSNLTKHTSFVKPGTELELDFEEFILNDDYIGETPAFKESLAFSKLTNPNTAPKYFREVNIKVPATYKGHKLKEDGSHYDYRFFNGFSTEIPESIHKPHSPDFPPDQYKYPEDGSSNLQINYDSSEKRKKIILSNLIHTLLTFSHESNHPIILAHGSLLAWYFNGVSFPWDNDSDVQMPINQLLSFCDNFNQSMVIQNPTYGFGKYFLDCSSFLTHRKKSNGNNNIDARFIDIDTGFFVDITGLAVSSQIIRKSDWSKMAPVLPNGVYNKYPIITPTIKTPKVRKIGHLKDIDAKADEEFANGQRPELSDEFVEKVPKVTLEEAPDISNELYNFNLEYGIINCRNLHFYLIDKLKSLKLTKFENGHAWIPKDIKYLEKILADEYTVKSMEKQFHDSYFFVKELKMWVPAMSIYMGCKDVALDISSRADLSSLFDNNRNIRRARKAKSKKTLEGNHVSKCFNRDPNAVINKMINMGISNLFNDYEFTQTELTDHLAKANVKLPKGIKVQYLNVLEELFAINKATSLHQAEMNEIKRNWNWNDNSFTLNEPFNIELKSPPLRNSMLDYLIEIDN